MFKIAGLILLVGFVILFVWGFLKGWRDKNGEL